MPKRALITGITGQDGSYLAELLLTKGYEVHGLVRALRPDTQSNRAARLAPFVDRLHLTSGDIESSDDVRRVVALSMPDECYHLAAQTSVGESFAHPLPTLNTNVNGTLHTLAALKSLAPACRFFFAASSAMFGDPAAVPQTESTPFDPRSPYAISKVAAFHLTRLYRAAHSLHASAGILFNHESPRRGPDFVTRKITLGIARILRGESEDLHLGDLESRRDWGHARDTVEAMWIMLRQPAPDDYVIATGRTHSVREFAAAAFAAAGLDYTNYVREDPALRRPAGTALLQGDASKAARVLGWSPKVRFEELVREMVEADCRALMSRDARPGSARASD